MSFNNIKTRMQAERGFTIVELLIVIVVIAILAAITIVSFNGVTGRANSANARTNAETVQKVAEAYNADMGAYPTVAQILATWTPVNGGTQSSQLPSALNLAATAAAGVLSGPGIADAGTAAKCTSTSTTATCLNSTYGTKVVLFTNKGTTGDCIGYFDFASGTTFWVYAGNASTVTYGSSVITCS
jgi:prepilin-type N-terminal cleavage/methylation domain-containing protein